MLFVILINNKKIHLNKINSEIYFVFLFIKKKMKIFYYTLKIF